ncbi:MAG: hypothetical protein QXG76_02995 [Candidatus Bathyarchaeia archaeon]
MKMERAELVAYILIAVGLLLLVITFIMAYLKLESVARIITSTNISEALGQIFGPIVEAVIKIMFLGIMGWTGSITTMRGIQLYKEVKAKPISPPSPPPTKLQQVSPPQTPQLPQQAQQPKPEEKKS